MNPPPDGTVPHDPLRAAFTHYQRAPRDIATRPERSTDNLSDPIPSVPSIAVSHYDVTTNGVTKHTALKTVTRPMIPNRGDNE